MFWSTDPTISLPGESHGRTTGYGVLLLQWIALLYIMYWRVRSCIRVCVCMTGEIGQIDKCVSEVNSDGRGKQAMEKRRNQQASEMQTMETWEGLSKTPL